MALHKTGCGTVVVVHIESPLIRFEDIRDSASVDWNSEKQMTRLVSGLWKHELRYAGLDIGSFETSIRLTLSAVCLHDRETFGQRKPLGLRHVSLANSCQVSQFCLIVFLKRWRRDRHRMT